MKIKLESTYGQLEEFKESSIWRDINKVLQEFIDLMHNKLESAELEEIRYYQGAIGKVRDLMELPDELIKLKEDKTNGD